MRGVVAIALCSMATSRAYAQPAVPAPQQVQLTTEEEILLERGYIPAGQQYGGAFVSFFVGFGLGHAVQQRWSEKGYVFFVLDGLATAVFLWGFIHVVSCTANEIAGDPSHDPCRDSYGYAVATGAIAGLGFRTWEVADALIVPSLHNRDLRKLRRRIGLEPARASLYVAPNGRGGGVAGLSLRF